MVLTARIGWLGALALLFLVLLPMVVWSEPDARARGENFLGGGNEEVLNTAREGGRPVFKIHSPKSSYSVATSGAPSGDIPPVVICGIFRSGLLVREFDSLCRTGESDKLSREYEHTLALGRGDLFPASGVWPRSIQMVVLTVNRYLGLAAKQREMRAEDYG